MEFATKEKPVTFWADNYEGNEAQGGFFLRNALKEFIQKLEESGETPVAIRFDGSWNLEILTKPKPTFHEGQSITYNIEINIDGADVPVIREGIIRFNEQTEKYFIEAEDGEEIPLEDLEDVEIIFSQV